MYGDSPQSNNEYLDDQNNYDNYQQDYQAEEEQIDSSPLKDEAFDPLGGIASSFSPPVQEITTKDDEIQKGQFMNNIASMTINIGSFEEKKIDGGKNAVVFYKMQVGFTKNNKSWYLEKRYSEFDTLNTQLKDFYPGMPELPSKTLFKLSNQQEIATRMTNLNNYMKQLINRRDMRTSPYFRKFIAIEQHFSQSKCFEAKKIGNMAEFGKGVRDFIYMPQYQTGFVALSDMNIISRMDSYFTNMSLPWEKKGKKETKSVLNEEAVSTVGALQHFRIQESTENLASKNNNLWVQQPSWAKTYASQTNILHWCDEQSTLYNGLDSGTIHRYQCDKSKMCVVMKELPEITVHNVQMRIMGISVDPRVNHMFSISESGYLIVSDLNQQDEKNGCKFICSQNLCSSSGLKAMIHDISRNILFIASGKGDVFIMNSIPSQPELILRVETDQKVCIRGLTRSFSLNKYWGNQAIQMKGSLTQNFLMASDINGYITIFDINTPGKEKLTKRIGNTQGKPKQRIVIWRDQGREIISGDEDGYVTFWYSKEGNALYVFKAHAGAITQMRWNEDTQQLITCSKDKNIKVWQIPPRWIDESLKSKKKDDEDEQEVVPRTDYRTGIEDQSIWPKFEPEERKQEAPKQQIVQRDDSDDEDLQGWFK